jgi:RNA polymerase sigma-70 factor (ECF subfamily)
MRRLDLGQLGKVRLETFSSQNDTSFTTFEELAIPLLDSLYKFARWLVHSQNDAEDLVQETYLKALRHFTSFQPGTNFRAWMYRILRNTFLTSRTGLRAASTVSLDAEEEEGRELAVENETPETILMNHLNSLLVQSAIDNLPLHHREVLVLCDVEEMSYREIAEILQIPIGTVMSRLARARKIVRESLHSLPRALLSRDFPQSAVCEEEIFDVAAL